MIKGEQDANENLEMLQLINANRCEAGAEGLSLDSRLCRAAQIRAKEMADNQYLAHSRPDGSDIFSVYGEVGVGRYEKYWVQLFAS